ncbi:DNA polymerase IV [Marinimicrobium alkaliphilum]|uniref:DNA polymerase IV n=1 Tax=Marinimicrobium alkaliphilum TaxID=2202654 RepID=UPI000DBA6C62|nr:DNA polymerase IV [Marinimicrobium alkaliphilum]
MRKIIHCDADCFFAAVEIRDDPRLQGRAIAVGGNPDRRGVLSTCNYEARRYGIHSAMPAAHALRLCPDLIILPHRMDVYRDVSQAMRQIFYDYSERVEPLSLDEAFIDVSESEQCRGSATLIAQDIRARVRKDLGISVSAGVAPNKFLAKIASDWQKPDGLTVITPAQVSEFVARLPVRKIHGVGKAMAARLGELGVTTCGDLQHYSIFELSERFGAMGRRLHQLCRGEDDRPVNASRRRKSLSVEKTWSEDLQGLESCLAGLPRLLEKLFARLEDLDDDYRVVKLFVKIKFADFTQTTLERAGKHIRISAFRELCAEAYARQGGAVRLLGLGVRFVDLREDRAYYQLPLFGD